ncbi:hypothetical protein DQ04_03911010 [Trypanosoma grayi]|uniref:hypothetical protein n=1 Tax=Trypanosoma grayi TaxID=71804 RepID=UPI0004F49916|nr:hypothetical protein DQ04_03911010 [Trypanosoma grayi]KEG10302.1 hypothetical protein DQ04_03911010 [Trypanosoma grayi]
MAALNQVALLPGGCHQSCTLPVVGRSNAIAYCSPAAIYMYTPTTHTVNPAGRRNSTKSTVSAASAGDGKAVSVYPLTHIFANGVAGAIKSFDFNDEYVTCVTAGAKTAVWRLSDGEQLHGKRLPSGVGDFFKREGGPSVVRVAGKHHIIYGTTTGWVVTANMNDGTTTHQLKLANTDGSVSIVNSNSNNNNNNNSRGITNVGYVTSIDVAVSRPDTIVLGTSEGLVFIVLLHPVNGLQQTVMLRPFPAQPVPADTPLGNGSINNNSTNNNTNISSGSGVVAITAVSFDPHNPNLVAAGSREGALALLDIASNAVVQAFEVHGTPVISISWLAGQAGTFVTTDGESSKLRLWGVNSRTPALTWNPIAGSVLLGSAAFAPEHLLLALRNGSVVVYNTKTHQVEMQTEGGHTDTMHSCRYAHHDRELLATASTDGSIRVWNTKQLTLQQNIHVGQVIVHSVDWSPTGKYVAAGLNNGEVVCYHVSTQRENWRVNVTSGDLTWCLSWSLAESSSHIAVSHRGGVVVLSARDGKIVRRYKTKSPIFGIDFDPTHAKYLAAGCQDGKVLVFHVTSSHEEASVVLSGHSETVSSVLYNPIVSHFLLSCSHDGTLRLWDVSSMASHTASVASRVLRGHTERVSSIAWCSLAPYLALSGSADCTVRLWDVRNGMNVITVRSHSAEVLALSSHPERPLVFASASRDSTIVFWNIGLLRHVYLEAALGTLDRFLVNDTSSLLSATSTISVSVVAGDAVQSLLKDIKDTSLTPYKRMERIIGFFEFPCGAADVVRAVGYSSDPQDISNAKCTVVPASRLVEVRRKWGKSMVEKAHGKSVAGAGEEYKKTRLIEAAEAMLQLGKVSEYCQLMVEAGEWESAIAAAPLVGRDLWRSLCMQAGEAMEEAGDTRAVRYYIMAEESARAARLVARQSDKNWDLATVIAQSCPQSTEQTGSEPPHNVVVDTNGSSAVVAELLDARAVALANAMNPRIVTATELNEGTNDDAVMHLIYRGDVVIAHLLIHTVPLQQQTTIDAGYRLSMLQSCRQRQWDTALLCATRLSNPYDGLAIVLALYQHIQGKIRKNDSPRPVTSVQEKMKSFHERVLAECQRLQLPLDMENIQRKHANDGLASVNQIAAMVLSPNTSIGVETSEELVQTIGNFIDNLLQVALQDIDSTNAIFYMKQALAVSCYVSLPVHLPLKSGTATTSASSSMTFASGGTHSAIVRKFLAQVFLVAALMCVKVYRFPKLLNPVFAKARELAEGDSSLMALLTKVQQALSSYSPHSVEVDCMPLGATVPTFAVESGVQLKSVVTTEPISGAVHILEDGVSAMGKCEALQWMLCCAFSPLASGARMLSL